MMTYYLLTHILLTMSTGNEREGKDDIRIKIFTHYGKMLFESIFKEAHFSYYYEFDIYILQFHKKYLFCLTLFLKRFV